MTKIYFYEKEDGTIIDESVDSAWRLHKVFLQKRYQYLGWSDGRFVLEAQKNIQQPRKDTTTGITEKPSNETRTQLLEARDQEIQFARENPDKSPPVDFSKKEMYGAHGGVGLPKTPGLYRGR